MPEFETSVEHGSPAIVGESCRMIRGADPPHPRLPPVDRRRLPLQSLLKATPPSEVEIVPTSSAGVARVRIVEVGIDQGFVIDCLRRYSDRRRGRSLADPASAPQVA